MNIAAMNAIGNSASYFLTQKRPVKSDVGTVMVETYIGWFLRSASIKPKNHDWKTSTPQSPRGMRFIKIQEMSDFGLRKG